LLVRISNPRRAEKLRRAEKIINTCSLFSGVADYAFWFIAFNICHPTLINTYICVTII